MCDCHLGATSVEAILQRYHTPSPASGPTSSSSSSFDHNSSTNKNSTSGQKMKCTMYMCMMCLCVCVLYIFVYISAGVCFYVQYCVCFCPLQTPFQTVTVWVVRPVGIQTSLLKETPQTILVSQNSLLPTQRKDYITRMYYWLWRGGLVSSGGRADHTLSLYHTHSEGIPKRFSYS